MPLSEATPPSPYCALQRMLRKGNAVLSQRRTRRPVAASVCQDWLLGTRIVAAAKIQEERNRLLTAHERFVCAAKHVAATNPSGMRELTGMYESYMRMECGAFVTRHDA